MTNRIPIDSIVYQLSLLLPEQAINIELIEELATSAYRQINHESVFETKHTKLEIIDHKGILPDIEFYKTKIALVKALTSSNNTVSNTIHVVPNDDSVESFSTPTSLWTNLTPMVNVVDVNTITNDASYKPMYYDNNLTIGANICDEISTCIPSYKIEQVFIGGVSKNILYSNVQSGIVILTYLAYAKDIEDNEDVKQALIKYVIANIFLRKAYASMDTRELSIAKELEREAKTLMGRVKGILNQPDENTLEKIRMYNNSYINDNRFTSDFRFNPHRLKHLSN